MKYDRFHGRHDSSGRECNWPGCDGSGQFRAPGARSAGFDGPGEYRWFCHDHIRQFNAGYDYFDGMSADEIFAAQSPLHGWETHSRAFRPDAGIDGAPRWADFADPLEAISARARDHIRRRREDLSAEGNRFTPAERRALEAMGLSVGAARKDLRSRYTQLVRKYHPDHNGGDRSLETRLRQVVEAYQLLRKAAAFA